MPHAYTSNIVSLHHRSASNSETVVISAQLVTTNDIDVMADSELLLINNPIEVKFAINVGKQFFSNFISFSTHSGFTV